jgi:hypothetical protein
VTKRQAIITRLVAACFPVAMVVLAMLDSENNPTGQDAPFPHYWLYHGMAPIPVAFDTIGLIGLMFVWRWMSSWKLALLCVYALVATALLSEILLEAFFIVHAHWTQGLTALWIVGPSYLVIQWILTSRAFENGIPNGSANV